MSAWSSHQRKIHTFLYQVFLKLFILDIKLEFLIFRNSFVILVTDNTE